MFDPKSVKVGSEGWMGQGGALCYMEAVEQAFVASLFELKEANVKIMDKEQ